MPVREILLLGNPLLYQRCADVTKEEAPLLRDTVCDLHDTLMAFREKHGVGRAIAAPQIGLMKRVVYMHIDTPKVFINPHLTDLSESMIEIWDDCMSFPEILVRVFRHKSVTVEYRDMEWRVQSLRLEDDLSELLQHECDHLDGILAVSRAIDGRSFAHVSQRALLES